MFIDTALGTKEKPNLCTLDSLRDCKRCSLKVLVIKTWFVKTELLASEIQILTAAVESTNKWFNNFESKGVDKSLVLQPQGFCRDLLYETIAGDLW